MPPVSPPEYVTTDLHLASFLYSRGASLTVNERVRPKIYRFTFVADLELHDLLRAYWSGALAAVIPSVLLATPQKLKSSALGRGKRLASPSPASVEPYQPSGLPSSTESSSGFTSPTIV